jgi:hypothetical protein
VLTPNYDRFLQVQSELHLQMMHALEKAGTGLAVPPRELSGKTIVSADGFNPATAQNESHTAARN